MGAQQSFQPIKIPPNLSQSNQSSKIKPLVNQSQHQEVNSRNAIFNDMFQQQHTLAKRSKMEKIHFNK